jgi:hypothetical protein
METLLHAVQKVERRLLVDSHLVGERHRACASKQLVELIDQRQHVHAAARYPDGLPVGFAAALVRDSS